MNMDDRALRSDDATLRSIWFGFLAAPVAYAVVAWFAARDMAPAAYPQPLTALLAAAAIGAVLLGNVLPARLPAATGPQERRRTAHIVRWACYEAPAVLGLLLALLAGRFLPALAGSAIALVLIQASRPAGEGPRGGR